MSTPIYISRKDAKEQGIKTYNGKPCKKCNTTIKRTSNCNCVKCYETYWRSPEVTKQRNEYRKSPERKLLRKAWRIKKEYGLSWEDYTTLLNSQNGICAICLIPSSEDLYVDHNHDTGKVRGLLCSNCNFLLGFSKDNYKTLENAASYLKKTV